MANIDSDLIRGNIDTIILKTLLDGDKYGLDIIKEVETRSNGTYELKQPTLYSCLKRLENQELISSYWLDSDIGGRRHYYKLSEKGRETLAAKQEEWLKSKFIIDNLLSNFNSDEYRLVKKDDYDRIIEGKQFSYDNGLTTTAPVTESSENDEDAILPTEVDEEGINEPSDDFDSTENEETEEPEEVVDSTFDTYDEEESEKNDRPVVDYSTSEGNLHSLVSQYANIEIPDEYLSESTSDETEDDETDYSFQSQDFKTEDTDEEIEQTSFDFSYDENKEETEENLDEVSHEEFFSYDEDAEFEETEDEDHQMKVDDESADDDLIYYSHSYETEDEEPAPMVVFDKDQSEQEANALSFLRRQDEEEINTYVGDKNSYINHLNMTDENVVQQNLLDITNEDKISSVDSRINEFEEATRNLYNFNSNSSFEEVYEDETIVSHEQIENYGDEIDTTDNLIHIENAEKTTCPCEKTQVQDDDFLAELKELDSYSNSGFYNSTDKVDYDKPVQNISIVNARPTANYYDENDSSDASFEDEDDEESFGYNDTFMNNSSFKSFDLNEMEQEDTEETTFAFDNESSEDLGNQTYDYSDFDTIVSRSATNYTEENTKYLDGATFDAFVPRYTSENYKQKLSNLSAYSKVTPTEDTLESDYVAPLPPNVKDINALREEFEKEGIKVKEYRKHTTSDLAEKNYLLVNKINMIRSLILLFGYVFILSAVYIIISNTPAKNMEGFSFVYFLYGFIPFVIYAGYYITLYIINPYKKVPAKYAPRIMLFISIIITVQLLLITYCVNLQLGFYSFTQNFYNHLFWIIPTIISFAPIVSNLIYISLFYSKNFNV